MFLKWDLGLKYIVWEYTVKWKALNYTIMLNSNLPVTV